MLRNKTLNDPVPYVDIGARRKPFLPAAQDSDLVCGWGGLVNLVGLELPAHRRRRRPHIWIVCLPHRDIVCVPQRHCVGLTQRHCVSVTQRHCVVSIQQIYGLYEADLRAVHIKECQDSDRNHEIWSEPGSCGSV